MSSEPSSGLQSMSSDVDLVSSSVHRSGLYSLSSFNSGFVGKVQIEAQCNPHRNVQYLVSCNLLSDDTLCHHATLSSGLHVYAVSGDLSAEDAFFHYGKESVLKKPERKQISDSINSHFGHCLQPANDSPICYHVGQGNFKEATLSCYGLEDKLSTVVDTDLSIDDQHLEALVASEFKPRALVLQAWPIGKQSIGDKQLHFHRAMSLVDQQVKSGLGYVLCVEPSFDREPLPEKIVSKLDEIMKSSFAQKTFV